MNEPMDIDLSLDEIIAKKRLDERASKRAENRHNPYSRPFNPPTGPKKAPTPNPNPLRKSKSNAALQSSISLTDIKSKLNNPTFPTFSNAALLPTPNNLHKPCRELSVGIFSNDITLHQIRDLIQSTIGPVHEIRLDSKGVAWIRMLRWQGWEVYSFLNGKVLDGAKQLNVRVYPLGSIPPGSNGNRGRRRSG